MNLTEYTLKSREERTSHIDLSTPCILGNTSGPRRAKKALLEKFGLENDVDNWKTGKIETCHLCACDSKKGYCENPDHLYIGTPKENCSDKDPEDRKTDSRVGNVAVHAEKNEEGKSVVAVKAAEATHAEKNEEGKSVNAVKAGERAAEKTSKAIKLINNNGRTYVFSSLRGASRELGLIPGILSRVVNGQLKSTGGYTAEFI